MASNISLQSAPFIVGVGRSGTTLLRLMLDKHPLLCIPPETHFIVNLVNRAQFIKDAESFLDVLIAARTWRDFDLDAAELRNRLRALPDFSISEGLRSFYSYYAEQHNKIMWGDKTPLYGGQMLDIHNLLPEAFFIHLIRDGRDSALSYRGLWFGPGNDLAKHAKMWAAQVMGYRSQAAHLDGRYMEVRYESLIMDPRHVLKQICEALGLEFQDVMLEYHQTAQDRLLQFKSRYNEDGSVFVEAERIHKIFELTSAPPDKNRIGRWRTEMATDEQMLYESEAGYLLNELGYETHYPELWNK